ncbi:aminoglycoside phosphotransferase family protein [Nocardioides sp.]|uniref:aminoglycoside phosphotransferase family protein n=1 Tax=Nocardioides sp. TaxID=35761 RepID=UPI003D12199B
MRLPAGLLAFAAISAEWDSWLQALPALVDDLLEEWQLDLDGPATHGYCAVVVPVRTIAQRPAMLKVGWPHPEAEHEHLALKQWAGRGAVELLRADPRRFALLLERLDPTDLSDLWDLEACEIVGGLYSQLHVPALPQLRTLSSYVEQWTAELSQVPRSAPIPPRLVQQAVSLGRGFLADPSIDATTIHGDLHYGNVLAAHRSPWLAIDPKPMSGDPHFELAPMLFNRYDELAGDVRDGVRRRFHTLVDVAGLDEHRARDWVVVRMMHNAMWWLQDPQDGPRVAPGDHYLTMCVAIAKAVQD